MGRQVSGCTKYLGLGLLALVLISATPAHASVSPLAPETCNARGEISYVGGANFPVPGNTVRIGITLGAGTIQNGTHVSISAVRLELDCNADNPLGLSCTDDGAVIEYDGNITTTCGVIWSDNGHGTGTLPNEVLFTPSSPIVIAAGTTGCEFEFDAKVLTRSGDPTP